MTGVSQKTNVNFLRTKLNTSVFTFPREVFKSTSLKFSLLEIFLNQRIWKNCNHFWVCVIGYENLFTNFRKLQLLYILWLRKIGNGFGQMHVNRPSKNWKLLFLRPLFLNTLQKMVNFVLSPMHLTMHTVGFWCKNRVMIGMWSHITANLLRAQKKTTAFMIRNFWL